MIFNQLFLCFALISCRRLVSHNKNIEIPDDMIALGSMKHGHVIRDSAFFYDFMILSVDFNKQNLDKF